MFDCCHALLNDDDNMGKGFLELHTTSLANDTPREFVRDHLSNFLGPEELGLLGRRNHGIRVRLTVSRFEQASLSCPDP